MEAIIDFLLSPALYIAIILRLLILLHQLRKDIAQLTEQVFLIKMRGDLNTELWKQLATISSLRALLIEIETFTGSTIRALPIACSPAFLAYISILEILLTPTQLLHEQNEKDCETLVKQLSRIPLLRAAVYRRKKQYPQLAKRMKSFKEENERD